MLVEKEPPAETLHSLPGPKSFGRNAEETLIGRRTARVSPLARIPDECPEERASNGELRWYRE